MTKKALFADDHPTARDPIDQNGRSRLSSKSSANSSYATVGDHIHDLSERQLQKLVSLKFNNDPFLLVRQLSRDLAEKEAELILLRRESAQREHELARLCIEYGNLSSLEVDQRLAALKPEENVGSVLSDMIGSAVRDSKMTSSDQYLNNLGIDDPNNHTRVQSTGEPKPMQPTRPAMSTKTPARDEETKKLPNQDPPHSAGSVTEEISGTQTQEKNQNKRNSQWLNWLKSASSINASGASSKNTAKSRSQNTGPVELGMIIQPTDAEEVQILEDSQTDKFGFYNSISIRGQVSTPLAGENLSSHGLRDGTVSRDSSTSSSFADVTAHKSNVLSPQESGATDQARLLKSMEKLKLLGQQHDVKSEQLLGKWDTYMGNVERFHSRKENHEGDHELFGFKAARLHVYDPNTSWFFSKSEDEKTSQTRLYKELIQLSNEEGFPPRYRNLLWLELSGARNKSVPGEFHRLLTYSSDTSDQRIKVNIEQANLDVHRTLSSNKFFFNVEKSQPGPHFTKLQNILHAFIAHNPEVGYSQGMNRVVGNLILGASEGSTNGTLSLSEENIFWIFVCIVEDLLPRYGQMPFYHPKALPYIQRDTFIAVNRYLEKLAPHIYRHLRDLQIEIEIVVFGWWLGLFTETLNSLDLWFTVVDGLMLAEDPGVKLITYSVVAFRLYEKNLLSLHAADDVYDFFHKLKMGSVSNIRLTDFVSACVSIETQVSSATLEELRTKTSG